MTDPTPDPLRAALEALADDWERVNQLTILGAQVCITDLRKVLAAHPEPERREALSAAVEIGAECFHGTPGACSSYRCGSNCTQRFDRMHPCPACLIAEIQDLRARVKSLGGDPYSPTPTVAHQDTEREADPLRPFFCADTGSLTDAEKAIHDQYQRTDPNGDYYDGPPAVPETDEATVEALAEMLWAAIKEVRHSAAAKTWETDPFRFAYRAQARAVLAAGYRQEDGLAEQVRTLIEALSPRWECVDLWQRSHNDAARELRALLDRQAD